VGSYRPASWCSTATTTRVRHTPTFRSRLAPVRGLRELSIVTTGIAGGAHVRFAVFVTSDTPDPTPANNFAERAVP